MSLLGEGPTLGGWCHIPGGFAAEVMAAAGSTGCSSIASTG